MLLWTTVPPVFGKVTIESDQVLGGFNIMLLRRSGQQLGTPLVRRRISITATHEVLHLFDRAAALFRLLPGVDGVVDAVRRRGQSAWSRYDMATLGLAFAYSWYVASAPA